MPETNYDNAFDALGDAARSGKYADGSAAEANDLARAQVYATLALVDALSLHSKRWSK